VTGAPASSACELAREPGLGRLWIDYVGDVGDGWHPTYGIAYYLAKTRLHLGKDVAGRACNLPAERGDLLIVGGDEVYSTASRGAYERRLLGPYETALRERQTPPYPHAFAIPGNHDWHDSLASFIRLFTSRRWFGGWRTRQRRSYFALRLPKQWWLLGTDVQLGSDIDRPQRRRPHRRAHGLGDHAPVSRPASYHLGRGADRRRFCKNVIRLSRQQACSLVSVHGQAGNIFYKRRRKPALLPGEVSLAHYGVLLLDELSECRRHGRAGRRQPLENGIT
jgi:Magnesium chelatase, subunit ChlI/Calcineurin-like phosphoesterase